jgi:hypothetical protein
MDNSLGIAQACETRVLAMNWRLVHELVMSGQRPKTVDGSIKATQDDDLPTYYDQ